MSEWVLSSSSDRRALDVVDGVGACAGHGPHYSRRTPGSRTFTGIGQEIVLVTDCGRAVWACVRSKGPDMPGTGWRSKQADLFVQKKAPKREPRPQARSYLFRNVMFRNLGAGRSSDLIKAALAKTRAEWVRRYGAWPRERLRTEVEVGKVRSTNPGFCYIAAGWERGETKGGKLYLWAPEEA